MTALLNCNFGLKKTLISLMLFIFFEKNKKEIFSYIMNKFKGIRLKKILIWSIIIDVLIWCLDLINFENNKIFLRIIPIALICFIIFMAVEYSNIKRGSGNVKNKINFFTGYMLYSYFLTIFIAYASKVVISFLKHNEVKLEVMQIIPRFYYILIKFTTQNRFVLILTVIFIILSIGKIVIKISIGGIIKERMNYVLKILLSFFVSVLWLFFLQTYLLIIDMFNVGEIKDILGPHLKGEVIDKSLIIAVLSLQYVASLIVINLIRGYLVQDPPHKGKTELISQRYKRKRRYGKLY